MCAQSLNSPHDENESGQGPFQDPVLNSTLVEDPLFKFLSKNWRQVGVVLLAAFVIYFAVESFKDTYQRSMQRAADLFVGVQKQMDSLSGLEAALATARKELGEKNADTKADAKAKEDAATKQTKAEEDLKKAEERLKEMLVALADSREPYNHLASTYKGLLAWKAGELDMAKAALEPASKWQSVPADGKERVFMEGAALALAGLLIERPEFAKDARGVLLSLAKEGTFVNVVAGLRLSRLASTPEERNQALTLLEELNQKYPEQTELLSKEISQLR